MDRIHTTAFLEELRMETRATRRCLERIPEKLYDFRPHPKSMDLGYLTLLVAEIPLWIVHMIRDSEIDFETFQHARPQTTEAMLAHFDDNVAQAEKILEQATDDDLEGNFTLRSGTNVLYTAAKKTDVATTINHWVHHRGQLTVYMRMNDLAVPSIYGPSADEKTF